MWDTVLDEYPMPDPAFLSDELEQNYGYMDTGAVIVAQLVDSKTVSAVVEKGPFPFLLVVHPVRNEPVA